MIPMLPVPGFGDIPIVVNPSVPLRRSQTIEGDDYESLELESDVLCMRIGHEIHVHPDRMHWFDSLPRRSR